MTGKSFIGARLAGKEPNPSQAMSSELEHDSFIAGLRRSYIVIAPGSFLHGTSGLADLYELMKSRTPPKVICIVVADGFHATSSKLTTGYIRPGSGGNPVAQDLNGFREYCRTEEISYLGNLLEQFSQSNLRARIPALITIANKRDLWSAANQDERIPLRYQEPASEYGQIIERMRTYFGFDNPSTHDIISMYTFGGGFQPNPNINARALTLGRAEADAMVLKSLIYYRYMECVLL